VTPEFTQQHPSEEWYLAVTNGNVEPLSVTNSLNVVLIFTSKCSDCSVEIAPATPSMRSVGLKPCCFNERVSPSRKSVELLQGSIITVTGTNSQLPIRLRAGSHRKRFRTRHLPSHDTTSHLGWPYHFFSLATAFLLSTVPGRLSYTKATET
jgi:hypothetical protein